MTDLADAIPNGEEVGKLVKRKVGGVPVAVWLGAGIITVAGVAWWRRRSKPAAAPAESETGDNATAAVPYGSSVLGTTFTAPGSAAGQTNPVTDVPSWSAPVPRTNSDWRSSAESYAIAQGFTPTTVTAALAKFLNGDALTQQERAIVDTALRNVGPTPEPVPPPYNVPEPIPGNSDGGEAPPSGVGDGGGSTPRGPAAWRRLSWGVMGNLTELLNGVRQSNPQTASMTDAQLIALLEQYGYAPWQRETGGKVVVYPNGPPPIDYQS